MLTQIIGWLLMGTSVAIVFMAGMLCLFDTKYERPSYFSTFGSAPRYTPSPEVQRQEYELHARKCLRVFYIRLSFAFAVFLIGATTAFML